MGKTEKIKKKKGGKRAKTRHKLIKEKRLLNIINYFTEHKAATLAELADLNNVSIDTVRRDLALLEKEGGNIKRVHGGAVSIDGVKNQSFQLRNIANRDKKSELASLVDHIVKDGQAIAINNGTTNIEIARRLAKYFKNLAVITNSLSVVNVFAEAKSNNVIVLGGLFDPKEYCVYGPQGEKEIAGFNIDAVILAVNAISLEKGITDFRMNEVGVIRAMMAASEKCYVVADSSKFETMSYLNVCGLDEIDAIITDSNLPEEIYELYTRAGVKILRPNARAEA